MDNKPVLWDRTPDKVQSTLRQPKGPPKAFLNSSLQSSPHSEIKNDTVKNENSNITMEKNLNVEEIVAKSVLNSDAEEWYPKGHNIPTNFLTSNGLESVASSGLESLASSVQSRLKLHKKTENDGVRDSNYYPPFTSINEIDDSADFKRLKQIISTLTKDPGQFHNLLELFLETLAPYFNDIMALSEIVKILLEQAINNANFRYTGARLCWYIEPHCPQFRAELHMGCIKQLEVNSNTQNVLLFIAELYTQLPHHNVYGVLLIDSLKRLFSKGGDENIKCICQALKLTGYTLEQSNQTDLKDVLNQLESVKNTVRGSASVLLQTVLNLRSSNWGHSNEGPDSDQECDGFLFEDEQTPVFFNTEGEALTNEESEFIAAHINSNDDILSDFSDPDELCDPEPEMDEEIQEAFREFVKFSGSKH